MSRLLLVKPKAEQDITEVREWYESKHAGLGDEFVLEVDSTLEKVLLYPATYKEVSAGYRRTLVARGFRT